MMPAPEVRFIDRDYVLVNGRKLLYLAGTDYHRLSGHPLTRRAMARAAENFGAGPTASRVTTGNHKVYSELEDKIAGFFETEGALVSPDGYLSNMILLQAIGREYDSIFIDERSHPSIRDAANMAAGMYGTKVVRFRHMSSGSLRDEIRKNLRKGFRPLVMTDGVFPYDGSIPPLEDYIGIIQDYEGRILLDDAHAMAVAGPGGKGSWEEKGIERERIYQTGTLSKGFGVSGGIITGNRELIGEIWERSDAFAGCTGLSLPLAAAGMFTVSYLTSNRWKIRRLQEKTIELKERFKAIGLQMPPTPVPVFPLALDDPVRNERLKDKLVKNGIYPSFIRYPGAPAEGLFRFIITSATTDEQINLLFETVKTAMEEMS